MREPFQVLVIPYRVIDNAPQYCVLRRADCGEWQFIAGGGEDDETPLDAAKRETFEEAGVESDRWIGLQSLCYLPVTVISEKVRSHWGEDVFVIPEYAFAVECTNEIRLSNEHTEYVWLGYDSAYERVKWDSNRTALYELNRRVTR